jgi:hypothetical protein
VKSVSDADHTVLQADPEGIRRTPGILVLNQLVTLPVPKTISFGDFRAYFDGRSNLEGR